MTIRFVERQLKETKQTIFERHEDLQNKIKKVEINVGNEAEARKRADIAGASILEKTMTGDIQVEVMGLLYVVVGLLIANTSQELAEWFA